MTDREAHRFDHLSDGHLADKAAYGDSGAFVALADRFHDRVWTVAALAAADGSTATRATARAFTRTLAGVAAGIGDPDACVERALVAAAFELAATARIDEADLVEQLPTALRALDPGTRVALWLTTARDWSDEDAVAAVTAAPDLPTPALDEVTPAARQAAATLALETPAGLAAATADAWHEWQGIGLTIPERHPLTAVLSRLDVPLGRMGDALGRAGSRTSRTTRRRRARATAEVAPATPPPPVLLPIGAETTGAATTAGGSGDDGFVPWADAAGAEAAAERPEVSDPVGDLALATAAGPTTAAASSRVTAAAAASAAVTPAEPAVDFFGPRDDDELTLPERRRSGRGSLVTAGSTPTRTRVLAALAAGILTASAMGSLLTSTPAESGPARSEQIAADSPTGDARGQGDLLDDGGVVPAVSSTAVDDPDAPGAPGSTAGPGTTAAGERSGTRPTSSSGDLLGGSGGAPSAGGSTGGAPAAGPGGSGSGGGGAGIGGGSTPTPTTSPAPTPTTQPPTPTTQPPTPTTQPPTPTTQPPPPTTAPGPVCTLLPILCPGGGLIPG